MLYRAPYVVCLVEKLWVSTAMKEECWMYASHVIHRHVLVVPVCRLQSLSYLMKTGCSTITRQTGELCASFISLCTLYIQDIRPYLETRSDMCVHVRYVLCYCSKSSFFVNTLQRCLTFLQILSSLQPYERRNVISWVRLINQSTLAHIPVHTWVSVISLVQVPPAYQSC